MRLHCTVMAKLTDELISFWGKCQKISMSHQILIKESDSGATLKSFYLDSEVWGMEELPIKKLCKGSWKNMHKSDCSCDGAALLYPLPPLNLEDFNDCQLLLVELKSKLVEKNFLHAVKQLVFTMLKLHSCFSLCVSYTTLSISLQMMLVCSDDDWLMWHVRGSKDLGELTEQEAIALRALARGLYICNLKDLIDMIGCQCYLSILPLSLLDLPVEFRVLCSGGKDTFSYNIQ